MDPETPENVPAEETPAEATEKPDTTERLKAKQPSRRKRRARRKFTRARHCRMCADKTLPDYKDPRGLRAFLTDEGKILPRRVTGSCAKHQRGIAVAVKRARALALLPTSAAELY